MKNAGNQTKVTKSGMFMQTWSGCLIVMDIQQVIWAPD